jgi:hypothetical protein
MGEPDGSRIRLEGAAPLQLQAVTIRDAAGKALVEGLTLSVRPKVDYAQDRVRAELSELRLALPSGDSVTGVLRAESGPLSARPATTFEAQLDARVAALLRPFLAFDPGALEAKVSLGGRHEGQSLSVTQAAVRVNRAGGALLTAATLLQPVQGDLQAKRWAARDATAPAARLELGEIPLAWAGAYLPASQLSGTLSGATLTVAWAADGSATLNTTAPLTLRGATVALEQKPQVNNLDLTLDATATRRESSVSFAVRKLEARQGEESLLQLDAEGELTPGPKPAGKVKGALQAEALLFRQPALAALLPLAQGRIRTTFDTTFKVGDALAAKLTLTTRGLGLRGAPALGDADLGDLALDNVDALDALSERDRHDLSQMVMRSNHPKSRALADALPHSTLDLGADITEIAGLGLVYRQPDRELRLTASPDGRDVSFTSKSEHLDSQTIANFSFREILRADARAEVARIHDLGLEVHLASGDAHERALTIARELRIPEAHVHARMSPEDKAELVKSFEARQPGSTLMLGDGINDALAFSAATLAGTPAIDRPTLPARADFFLTTRGLGPLSALIRESRLVRDITTRNLVLAFLYNGLGLFAALMGWLSPVVCAVAMPASSLLTLALTIGTPLDARREDSEHKDFVRL